MIVRGECRGDVVRCVVAVDDRVVLMVVEMGWV